MKTTQKWNVRDVITTVLLTVLLIVIQLIVNMVCMANDFVSMVLSVGFTMFLCAPVYFSRGKPVHKRFVTLIYMTILGLVFLIMGNWYLLPYYIVVGIICEAILWRDGWKSKKENDGGLVGGKPVVQRRESSADLVFLGYLRSLCPLQRHGAKLH